MKTHTTILKVTGEDPDAILSVIEGANSAHKFAKQHDKTLKIEVQNED